MAESGLTAQGQGHNPWIPAIAAASRLVEVRPRDGPRMSGESFGRLCGSLCLTSQMSNGGCLGRDFLKWDVKGGQMTFLLDALFDQPERLQMTNHEVCSFCPDAQGKEL